ncbi:MAG TPA: hypothetical protein VGC41_01845 [Kofleriaceae bacterium]
MQRPARLPVLIALLCASHAFADDGEPDAARAKATFEKGRELVKAGNSAEACPLFEESLRLVQAPGTKLNLAICWAATGKLVAAQGLFGSLTAELADQPQRLQIAQAALEALKSRVPHVTIDATAVPEGDPILIDGKRIETGAPLAVDPGKHQVTSAHALPAEFEAEEGKTAAVKLEVPVAVPRPRQIYYVGGAAVGALVISAVTGLAVLNERSNALHHCADSTADGSLACSQRGIDLLDRAHTMSHVSTGFLVAGAALAAFTAVLEVKWRRSNESPMATAWTAPHAAGIALEASW